MPVFSSIGSLAFRAVSVISSAPLLRAGTRFDAILARHYNITMFI